MRIQFNAYTYFTGIAEKLKISKDNEFYPCKVSGLANMEEVLSSFRGKKAYFAIDDTNDGIIYQGRGGGYFERKMYTIFILKKITAGNMDMQHQALNICRQIYHSVCTRLIKDRRELENEMIYLDTERIPFYELEGYAIAGCTGLYFMITVDQPRNLCYDTNEWYE
ncbi:hypothetical protein [Dysgonomonas macrotermitis]|uniref:Uncharacterized protein n=1 Tax=Dysgonomonas macrotermitis TaxID=1346286 RepID=A0A1M4UIU6_9BACT|nr:hypothetical protein [Dysgonomonas macrotermitis]SHE56578.1 hypothetical protein SAMN05444362_101615 [Dysgonomonas macrotermitis]